MTKVDPSSNLFKPEDTPRLHNTLKVEDVAPALSFGTQAQQ